MFPRSYIFFPTWGLASLILLPSGPLTALVGGFLWASFTTLLLEPFRYGQTNVGINIAPTRDYYWFHPYSWWPTYNRADNVYHHYYHNGAQAAPNLGRTTRSMTRHRNAPRPTPDNQTQTVEHIQRQFISNPTRRTTGGASSATAATTVQHVDSQFIPANQPTQPSSWFPGFDTFLNAGASVVRTTTTSTSTPSAPTASSSRRELSRTDFIPAAAPSTTSAPTVAPGASVTHTQRTFIPKGKR